MSASLPISEGHEPLKIIIISQVRFLCESLSQVLGGKNGISISECQSSLADAINSGGLRTSDLVLLDAMFPDGLQALHRLLVVVPEARVVILAVSEKEQDVLAWIDAGAAGYIPNTAVLDDLPNLLHGIRRGEQRCSAKMAGTLIRMVARAGPVRVAHNEKLTAREREILRFVGMGLANKEIARELGISVSTTKCHMHSLLSKLHVTTRSFGRGQRAGLVKRRSMALRQSKLGSGA